MTELVGKCFDYPIANFNHNNNIQTKYPNDPTHFVDNSDAAVDFKLATLDGDKIVLSELLKEKVRKICLTALVWSIPTLGTASGSWDHSSWARVS